MKGLVLSGGGGRGAYEYGVYRALHEGGVRFDVIAGTSVGAITAAFIASGKSFDEVEALWDEMGTFRIMQPRGDVWAFPRWTHLLYTSPLRKFLEEHLDMEAVKRSLVHLRLTAVNANTGELRVFRNKDINIDVLMASSAIPLLFPLVYIDGEPYWDGGAVANTPIGPAIEAGATEIYTVLLSPMGAKALEAPKNLWEAITRVSDLRLLGSLKEDIKNAQAINKLIERGLADPRWRRVDFHVISPSDGLGVTTVLNFSAKKAKELIAAGYADGMDFIRTGHEHPLEEQAEDEAREDMHRRSEA